MENKSETTGAIRVLKIILKIVFILVIALLITLLGTITYLGNTWKELSYAEIVFHLQTSIEGTNPEMVRAALIQYALPALVGFILLIVILSVLRRKNKKIYHISAVVALVALIIMNAISIHNFNKNTRVVTDFINSVFHLNTSDFVKEQYVNPNSVSLKFPEQKRNLIYIYLESMEATYSDTANGGAYSDNYIPRLTKLAEENEDFEGNGDTINGGIVLPGTNWTCGAMFSQTSGLPLELPIDENQIKNSDEFFPQLTTMGDILEQEGYINVVQMGSSADFGGMSSYYTKHGNYIIHDYDYAKKEGLIPQDYYEYWGYEDEKVFEFAKKDLTELAGKGQPFNYTMFTIDTHFEDGYVCRLCDNKFGDNQYANVISCSDCQVTDFVRWIQQQDFYNNTTVVITGDHTTMDADFCAYIDSNYQRKTYTCILNSAVEPQIKEHREYSTIDLFPTMLASLGVEMSSDRLGCGTNLFGTQQTLIEEQGKDVCISEFAKGSEFVESLAKVQVDEQAMEAAKEAAYIEVADENGMTRFRLNRADNINHLGISDLTLKVHDNTTNEDHEYQMEISRVRSGWHGVVHSDIPYTNVSNLSCEVYISVDEFKNYHLKSFVSEDFTTWDIKWDVD